MKKLLSLAIVMGFLIAVSGCPTGTTGGAKPTGSTPAEKPAEKKPGG